MSVTRKLLLSTVIGLTGLATAQADMKVNRVDANSGLIPAAANQLAESSVYIVQLTGKPVIAYDGDVKGYQATKPAKGKKLNPNSKHVKKYAAFLENKQNQAVRSVGAEKVYNYRYALNGFAARMTATEAEKLKKNPDVMNVWKDEIRQLQTDSSPTYIGVTEGGQAWSKGLTGENVVIGIVDTGVWPEHPSFADVKTPKKGNKGPSIAYGPIDNFTASGCDFGNTAANPADAPFACNNKLLAARCYNSGFSSGPDSENPCGGDGSDTALWEFQSGRDADGHGSHTASTSAGNNGVPAYIDGEMQGEISGVAPRARLASYKVCWDGPDPTVTTDDGCASSDSAAAIDQAVADGVDVINFSIGGSSNSFSGPDDIAFLFAAGAGVYVATSNGNSGPGAGTVGTPSGVPWITAVGATQDDGVFYNAITVNAPGNIADDYVAVEGAGPVRLSDTGPITDDVTVTSPANGCAPLTAPISGIALTIRGGCGFIDKYDNAAAAGATAIIVYNDGTADDRIDPIVMGGLDGATIPGVMVGFYDGDAMANETGVNATMDDANSVSAANRIAGFSSRGPNNGALDIIKPDLSAPGVAILAAGAGTDEYMSISGTSMASPHVAGSFALLKQAHPDWSPAMSRSALMTTARQGLLNTFGDTPADPFDVGAGEILPSDAVDPGLAYDAGLFEYAAFSCENNYQIFSDGSCAFLESLGVPSDGSDLNLPSIGIGDLVGFQTVTRTVTAVYNNNGNKTFTVSVDAPPGIDVSVSPSSFKLAQGDSMSYEVTFTVTDSAALNEWAFGSLTWTDEDYNYSVRSPIAVQPSALSAPASAEGTGTDGSLDYDVQFGYDGDFNAVMNGLTEGEGQPGTVADGSYIDHYFYVPAGTTLARFSLFDSEIGPQNDLDLQIQGPHTEGFPFVCSSGTPTSEEECDVASPAEGWYVAFVIDYASEEGDTPFIVWNFNLDGTDLGNTTITAPASASLGATGNIMVDWSGLNSGTRYLGIMNYDDGVDPLNAQTEIMVDTQ